MKIPVLLSITVHLLFISALVALPSRPKRLPAASTVYEVELVSLPRPVEEAPKRTEPPKSVRPEPSISVTPKKSDRRTEEASPPAEMREGVKESAKDTAEPVGAGGSNVKVDTEDFPFAYYLSLIRYRIQENWRPPVQSTDWGRRMTAVVGFRVLPDGQVAEVNLEMSSKRFLFDQAAQRAIRAMGNLPPLPDEFAGDYLNVHIEFESVW
jgi:TonB family protein